MMTTTVLKEGEGSFLANLEPTPLLHLLLAPAVKSVAFQQRLVHRDVPFQDKRFRHLARAALNT